MKKRLHRLVPALVLAVAGCSGAVSNGLDDSQSFVAVARPLDVGAASLHDALGAQAVPSTSGNESFYVAINRKELGQRWFMSAYLKQYFPGAVSAGAAISLGTKVVTFRVQNGKLFVFDASDNYKDSDTFDPTLIIDAYPIVSGYQPFESQANASKFILVDPSAGLNRFNMLSDAFAWDPSAAAQFTVDVAYLQDFRNISDGSTWEQVFTGAADVPINDGTMSGNVFKASGTLGIAWRKYAETPYYAEMNLPDDGLEHYFRSDAHLIPNSGQSYQTPIKWAVKPGMKPIKWLISDSVLTAQKNWPQYDIVGALKNAVLNWNAVFGYQVFDVDIAKPTDSYADDDKNYVLYDLDPSFGAAFANWRSNPNTGEIRGASIYFSDLWVLIADQEFADDVPGTPTGRAPQPSPMARPKMPMLSWSAMPFKPSCVMFAGDHIAKQLQDVPAPAVTPTEALTKKQKVERFLTHVLLHEVGHTLGLRHNFAGSLEPLSSSVMEYVLDEDTVHGLDKPGPYDVDAIKWLYGLSTALPTQQFCTDEDTTVAPDCTPYDATDNPLPKYYAPQYASVLGDFLSGANPTPPNTTLNNVLKYVRAGSAAQRLQAWQTAIANLQVPADANKVATVPGYGARVDLAARRLFSRLYIDDASLRGDFTNDPAADAQVTPLLVKELQANLVNSDKIRTYTTRRLTVDVLKKMQLQAAYDALVSARSTINASLSGLSGSDLNDAQDLLARIDQAIHPYFN